MRLKQLRVISGNVENEFLNARKYKFLVYRLLTGFSGS